ncbi:MlaD family protein [Patulibacter brassicae]|uniref:MlaD family protein n=1 Tax=Patulibacter brassicae TaxID=1705717 RepID=A0ABU4VQ15_9ACTN|nr:MlaD family protein [Patulibacter brassicae]MDX8153719.1 MlaD family protein [Patulibacter brassicae]
MKDPRDRMTHGVTRGRLLLELRRSTRAIPVLLIGAVLTVVGAALILSQLTNTLFKSTREARFAVSDAYGVLEGVDDVRYRGVPAGTIQEIERVGEQPVLRIKLRDDYPVYRDARAELRPETPLNDQYLDIIDPGTPKAGRLPDDEVVPASRTAVNVKINDVLNTLQANERTRLAALLDNLGNGLQDGGAELRRTLDIFTPFVREAGTITDELAKRETLVKRLIGNVGTLTASLGDREQQIRYLLRDGSAVLGTLQEGSADLDRTIRALPGTTGAINASLRAVDGVLGDVDGAIGDLTPIADGLPANLRTVRDLRAVLDPAVRKLAEPVERLVPLARTLDPLATDIDAAVAALRPQTDSLNKVTDSLVKCEKDVRGFFQWNASLSKFGDARGPIPRGNLAVGIPDVGLPGVPRRPAAKNCAGGKTIGGRAARKADEG